MLRIIDPVAYSATVKLDAATQDTRTIIRIALSSLKSIYKPGFGYQKCGVQLSAIRPASSTSQSDLFDLTGEGSLSENTALMQTLDGINRRFPKAVSIASSGFDKSWKPKAERISQRYNTDWRELVTVR